MESYTIVLICFLCLWSALTTNDLERSGLFCLGGYSSLSSEVGSGTQGRDLETRTKAEVIENSVTHLLMPGLFSDLSYTA